MTDKQTMLDGVDVLKEKINMCFILLLNKLETPETIEQTIYEHLDVFVEEWNKQLKRKEQECEELKRELQAQRDFTAHEQKLIYCVAYDETCKTGNDCKQEKCMFKDNIKLKQALAEIKEIAGKHKATAHCGYLTDMDEILQKINEVENAR